MLRLTLRGQIRGGKNHVGITRMGHRYPLKGFAAWRDNAIGQILAQPRKNFTTPCRVDVTYTPGDRRRRDVPAVMDALCHVLERANIVTDDCLLEDWSWKQAELDRENPGAEIVITEKP